VKILYVHELSNGLKSFEIHVISGINGGDWHSLNKIRFFPPQNTVFPGFTIPLFFPKIGFVSKVRD